MTLDRSGADELDRPVGSEADLLDYFRAGEKPASQWRIGMEHEALAIRSGDLRPPPFAGPQGIEALLARLADEGGWKPVYEGPHLVALDRDGQSITLEPGGQVELSGRPVASVHEAGEEFGQHLEALRRLSRPMGIAWLALGVRPLHGVADAPQVPKERYHIMRAYLPSRGARALEMMHVTASVQVSFDFADEADMVARFRAALGLAPVVSALYANSPLAEGRPTGAVSERMRIWRATDPDRCGGIPFVFDPDFGYRRYMDWALDVPMFFVLRAGRYLPLRGKTFRRFMAEGHDGERATLADWNRHLTTVFPDVRLKRVLEVRGADAGPADLACSVPALWKGVLYDPDARQAAWELVSDWSAEERETAYQEAARLGLAGEVGGRKLLDLARELVALAAAGLARAALLDDAGRDERRWLEPAERQVALGRSPGAQVVERWEGAWQGSPARLIDATRY